MISVLLTLLVVFLVAAVAAYLIRLLIPGDKFQQAALVVLGLIVFLIALSLLWPFIAPLLHLGAEPRSLR